LPDVASLSCDADTTDRFITMSSVDLARPRFARLSRNQLRLNTGLRLLAATDLGTDPGDRFEVSQGDPGFFKGGVRQADETA
jgi:hypothetical protein